MSQTLASDSPFKYTFLLKQISESKCTIAELAEGMGEKAPNTSKMVARLERLGYVKKTFSGVKRFIVLTEEGEKLLERVRE